MVYEIEFERKSDPSTIDRQVSTVILAKAKDHPKLELVHKLLERLYGHDVDSETVKISVAENWEQRTKVGVPVHELDQGSRR